VSLVVTVVVCLLLGIVLRMRARESSQLIEPRAAILTIGVQIICGDCSGDDNRPMKTLLGRGGNCAQCGGRSYILASRRTVTTHQIFDITQTTRSETTRNRPLVASVGHRTIAPLPARNPWIASGKLLNQDLHDKAS